MRNTVNSNEKEKLITRFKNASTHEIQKKQEQMSGRSSHAQTIDFTEIDK